jgi:hypothetical protein
MLSWSKMVELIYGGTKEKNFFQECSLFAINIGRI